MKIFLSLTCGIFLLASACNKENPLPPTPSNPTKPNTGSHSSDSSSIKASDEVLATINGQPITDAEVTDRVRGRLKKVEAQIRDIKKAGLEDMIEQRLLSEESKKRKLTIDQLMKVEVTDKVKEASDAEIRALYEQVKNRLQNKTLDDVKDRLVKQIQSDKIENQRSAFLENLFEKNKVVVFMKEPEVSVDDDPMKGNPKAKVTIIEFSEFQCPFCKKARPTIAKILETYGDKVRYVFRDFPLSFHKYAPKAAEAANCARDQNKYWEYAEYLWDNNKDLSVDRLKEYAKTLGLKEAPFNECLDSGKYVAEIQKDIEDGEAVGVSGTPAYFINGKFLSGAQPFENFQEIIDKELKKAH